MTQNNHITLEANDYVGIKEEKNRPMRYEVENIQAIDFGILEALEAGDEVIKITKEGTNTHRHTYIVSYKEQHVGICMTYSAAGYLETVSYDYTDGDWVYNSTDVWQAE